MTARNKARGRELENEVVAAATNAGLTAHRIFGSGAYKNQLGDDFASDVVVEGLRIECKRRKSGFKLLYDAFDQDDSDVVCVRSDRMPRMYLVREDVFLHLLKHVPNKRLVSYRCDECGAWHKRKRAPRSNATNVFCSKECGTIFSNRKIRNRKRKERESEII